MQTGPGPLAQEGDLSYLYNTDSNVGGLSNILYSKGLTFVPSEINTSIRRGWFWHKEEEPKSLEKLFRIYISSVGGNACLNLNIPPNRDGLLDERDVARLQELRELLNGQRVRTGPGGHGGEKGYGTSHAAGIHDYPGAAYIPD